MKKQFEVSLEKESLIFSAAHFITFETAAGETICESIHGHNYRVACRVSGELDDHACVIDFIWLRDCLKKITGRLDHHVVLAEKHPQIRVTEQNDEVEVRFQDRRWVFPKQDVALLPCDNTTAERLAEFIGQQLIDELKSSGIKLGKVAVGVDENEGQWGWCKWE